MPLSSVYLSATWLFWVSFLGTFCRCFSRGTFLGTFFPGTFLPGTFLQVFVFPGTFHLQVLYVGTFPRYKNSEVFDPGE